MRLTLDLGGGEETYDNNNNRVTDGTGRENSDNKPRKSFPLIPFVGKLKSHVTEIMTTTHDGMMKTYDASEEMHHSIFIGPTASGGLLG